MEAVAEQKVWDKTAIQDLLMESDRAVLRAVTAIYSLQTESEKLSHMTSVDNKVGFSAFDADILSSFAEQIKYRGGLSVKQMAIARNKMKRYWRQLVLIANGELKVPK